MGRCWPLPYSGLPAILAGLSMMCFTIGIIATLLNIITILAPLLALGLVLTLLSVGRSVDVTSDGVVLSYGFPVVVMRYVVRDVVKVFDVKELDRGALVRYFKQPLLVSLALIAVPLTYLAIEAPHLDPAHLPMLLVPTFLGIVIQVHTVLTANSYRRFVIGTMVILGLVWVSMGLAIAITGWGALSSSLSTSARFFISVALLTLAIALYATLGGKRHVVIVESSDGKFYAVGTPSAEDAKRLVKRILEVMARNA